MKSYKRIISLIISFVLLAQVFYIPVSAEENIDFTENNIIYQSIDETNDTGITAISADDITYYIYTDETISYCAQVSSTGKIQFSYMNLSNDIIYESPVYDISDMYEMFNITLNDNYYYDTINTMIISNLSTFDNAVIQHIDNEIELSAPISTTTSENIDTLAMPSDLQKAVANVFGENYSNKRIALSIKTYNGASYTVKCIESQSTSYTTISTRSFAAETAVTVIVAWVVSGGLTWVGVVQNIIASVITLVLLNGVKYTINSFTAQRTNVSCMRNRNVRIDTLSVLPYWAGWTRKLYFFKGEHGWTHDADNNYDLKHSDYDYPVTLMNKGFQNFIADF